MRQMDLTDLVALVERTEPDPGPEPGSSEHTSDDISRMAEEVLAGRPDGPVWLFAYGSLIWNPDFAAAESMPGIAKGWHRAFCLKLTRWRGTREKPALMLALDRGGSCAGILYRLPDDDLHSQINRLLKRELDDNPPTNVPRWVAVTVLKAPGGLSPSSPTVAAAPTPGVTHCRKPQGSSRPLPVIGALPRRMSTGL